MIFRAKGDVRTKFPDVYMNEVPLVVSQRIKYLGHFITDDMRDNDDIARQVRKLYVSANSLKGRFTACSDSIKCLLFNLYCGSLYTSALWCDYTVRSFSQVRVAYNDAFRILLGQPRYTSARTLFVNHNVLDIKSRIRKSMFSLLQRVERSSSPIIQGLQRRSIDASSKLRDHWRDSLYVT